MFGAAPTPTRLATPQAASDPAEHDRVAISGGFGVGFSQGDGDEVFGGRVGLQWTH